MGEHITMANYDMTNFTSVADPGEFIQASNDLSGGLIFNGILIVILVAAIILHYYQNKDLPLAITIGGSASTAIGLIFLIAQLIQPTIFFMCLSVMILGLIATGFTRK